MNKCNNCEKLVEENNLLKEKIKNITSLIKDFNKDFDKDFDNDNKNPFVTLERNNEGYVTKQLNVFADEEGFEIIDKKKNLSELKKEEYHSIDKQNSLSKYESSKNYIKKGNFLYNIFSKVSILF